MLLTSMVSFEFLLAVGHTLFKWTISKVLPQTFHRLLLSAVAPSLQGQALLSLQTRGPGALAAVPHVALLKSYTEAQSWQDPQN